MKVRKIIPFNQMGCFKCKNFRRHYVFGRGGYTTTNCGHCGKYKNDVIPDSAYKSCHYYEEFTLKERRVIEKQHRKELIERIDVNLNTLMHYLKK